MKKRIAAFLLAVCVSLVSVGMPMEVQAEGDISVEEKENTGAEWTTEKSRTYSVKVAENVAYGWYGDWKKIELEVAGKRYPIAKDKACNVTTSVNDEVRVIAGEKYVLWAGKYEEDFFYKYSGESIGNYYWEMPNENSDGNLVFSVESNAGGEYNGGGIISGDIDEVMYLLEVNAHTDNGKELELYQTNEEGNEGRKGFWGYGLAYFYDWGYGSCGGKVYAEDGYINLKENFTTLKSLGINTLMKAYETNEILGNIYLRVTEKYGTEDKVCLWENGNLVATIISSVTKPDTVRSGLISIPGTKDFLYGGEKLGKMKLIPKVTVKMAEGMESWKVTAEFEDKPVMGKYDGEDYLYAGSVKVNAVKTIVTNPGKSYKVSFDKNGGDSISKTGKKVTNGKLYGTLPTAKRKGYTFKGWYTKKSGGTKVTDKTLVNLKGNQTLYARWSKTKYKITYQLGGGTNNGKNPATYTYNPKTKIKLENPKRKGYLFKGWYKDKNYKKKITYLERKNTKNQTVYAKWSKVKVSKTQITKIKNIKSRKLQLNYKKVSGAAGYEISCSTDKGFRKAVTKKATAKTSYTLSKLVKNKTYYVCIRVYKKDSAGKKVYSGYSVVKKVKIKK